MMGNRDVYLSLQLIFYPASFNLTVPVGLRPALLSVHALLLKRSSVILTLSHSLTHTFRDQPSL